MFIWCVILSVTNINAATPVGFFESGCCIWLLQYAKLPQDVMMTDLPDALATLTKLLSNAIAILSLRGAYYNKFLDRFCKLVERTHLWHLVAFRMLWLRTCLRRLTRAFRR